jgi:CRP-like cAMP-binding protein
LLAWAARAGEWRVYARSQFVYHAGDPADGMYGLAAGRLEVTFPLVADEPVVVHRAETGYWFGDNALLAQVPRAASFAAVTESRLLFLPGPAIMALLARQPGHWPAFYRLNARNMDTAMTLLSEALALTVRARVCRRLLLLADPTREAVITQADLARLVGVARATLRRCLEDLAARGAIALHYGRLRVIDPAVLRAFKDEQ